MNFNTTTAAIALLGSATIASAAPQVSNVVMSQPVGSRNVTITYTLSEPAVVTLDVLTNAIPNAASGWASIGGEAICTAKGDVWRKIEAGSHTITWRPIDSWMDDDGNCLNVEDGCAKAVVTAWALDNTPDYMVVDISAAAQPNTQRYYPRVDFLPGSQPGQRGAVTNNPAYKSSMLVMRKIMAKDIIWTMGSTANEPRRNTDGREDTHQVSLSSNYYIGIFEITQGQWKEVATNSTRVAFFNYQADKTGRPMENVSWYELRATHVSGANGESGNDVSAPAGGLYPNDPSADSFLGLLRLKTGLSFDLPSESQWEFAARAGNGDCHYGDGTAILASDDINVMAQARYQFNTLYPVLRQASTGRDTPTVEGGTAIVGSYRPNAWGLYDTLGNVSEYCLDFYLKDISALGGSVCTTSSNRMAARGAAWNYSANELRPASRLQFPYNSPGDYVITGNRPGVYGFRVACPVGVE